MTSTVPDPAFLKWPPSTPESYIKARRELLDNEYALRNQIEEVAAARRALPPGPIMPEYKFTEGLADLNDTSEKEREVTLAEVAGAGKHKTLLVYHMMMGENATKACASCSMFVDGLNGVAKHLAERCNVVIIARAPLAAIRKYARSREWTNLRFLSAFNSTFNKDMNLEAPEWMADSPQNPGMSVFKVGEEGVRFLYQTTPHYSYDVIRGMDLLAPMWNLFDLTPEGRGDWDCRHDYVENWKGPEGLKN